MFRSFRILVVVLVAFGSALFVIQNSAQIANSSGFSAHRAQEKRSSRVELNEIPRAVRKTIKKETFGGRVIEVEKEYDDGKLHYEAEVVIGSYVYDVAVNKKGILLAKVMDRPLDDDDGDDDDGDDDDGDHEDGDHEDGDDDDGDDDDGDHDDGDHEDGDHEDGDHEDGDHEDGDHEDGDDEDLSMTKDQLPRAVGKTLKRETKGGEIKELEKATEDGKVIYSAEVEYEMELGELTYEIEIASNGVLLHKILASIERDSDDEDEDEDDNDEDDQN